MLSFGQRARRRRPNGIDKVTNTISSEGTAVLCFPPDGMHISIYFCTFWKKSVSIRGLIIKKKTTILVGREKNKHDIFLSN